MALSRRDVFPSKPSKAGRRGPFRALDTDPPLGKGARGICSSGPTPANVNLRDLQNRRNFGVHAPRRIAGLQSGDAGCIVGAVAVCSRSGTLAIPLWLSVRGDGYSRLNHDLL